MCFRFSFWRQQIQGRNLLAGPPPPEKYFAPRPPNKVPHAHFCYKSKFAVEVESRGPPPPTPHPQNSTPNVEPPTVRLRTRLRSGAPPPPPRAGSASTWRRCKHTTQRVVIDGSRASDTGSTPADCGADNQLRGHSSADAPILTGPRQEASGLHPLRACCAGQSCGC